MLLKNASANCRNAYIITFLMAMISGYSDVFSFVGLDRLFTAHITGNIVVIIAFVISGIPGVLSKAIAIPIFIILAIVIAVVIEKHKMTRGSFCCWVLIEILFFAGLLLAGLYWIPVLSITSYAYVAISMLPVAAMAIHNTLLRTYLPQLPPCTVMTGNLTQFVVDATVFKMQRQKGSQDTLSRAVAGIKRFGNAIIAFVLGGAIAAFGYIGLGFASLGFVILFLVALLIVCLTLLD